MKYLFRDDWLQNKLMFQLSLTVYLVKLHKIKLVIPRLTKNIEID